MSTKLASLLSVILSPQVWLLLMFLLFMVNREISFKNSEITVPLVFLLQIVIPLLGPYLAYKKGVIKDLDVPNRKDRVKFLLIASICWLISIFITYFYGSYTIFKMTLLSFILISIFLVITRFWKISIHVGVNTTAILFINYLYNWQFLFLFILIPIVAWSRYKLKVHTLSQVIAGFLVTFLVITIFLNLVR
jgi:membrane-associated phospholipid phosphatase